MSDNPETQQQPSPVKRRRTRCVILILALVYLSGPVIAAALRYPDKRGPRIYPEALHHTIFTITHMILHGGGKPRVHRRYDRAWFYGMNRPENERFARVVDSGEWFLSISPRPFFVPVLPADFIAGHVDNPAMGKGQPGLVWAPSDLISRLEHEIILPGCFLVSELNYEGGMRPEFASDRKDLVKEHEELGYTVIDCGVGAFDNWFVEWSSVTAENLAHRWVTFSHPNGRNEIKIYYTGTEAVAPVWENFLAPLKKRLIDFTPADLETIRKLNEKRSDHPSAPPPPGE